MFKSMAARKKKTVRRVKKKPVERSTTPSNDASAHSCSSYSSCSGSRRSASSDGKGISKSRSYRRIKLGLKKSNPAAIVLWAFHKLPAEKGLTARRVITFLKNRYKVVDNPQKVGKCIGSMLRCAVEFGLLEKRGNKYFLKRKSTD